MLRILARPLPPLSGAGPCQRSSGSEQASLVTVSITANGVRGNRCARQTLVVRSVLEPKARPVEGSLPSPLVSQTPPALSPAPAPPPVDAGTWRVLPDLWASLAEAHGDAVALFDPHRAAEPKLSFRDLHNAIQWFSVGLRLHGLRKGDCVALLAENSHRWFIADQGIMTAGACDAVRGTRSSANELQYIIAHSDSVGVIVDTEEVLDKVRALLQKPDSPVKFVVVLWPSSSPKDRAAKYPFPVLSFEDVLEDGRSHCSHAAPEERPAIREDDIASLVFTSGTTGEPKAVMLTHANLMHQIRAYKEVIQVEKGDVILSLLPPWHMYERSCEYFVLSQGVQLIYSGVKSFKEDLTKYPPDLFVAVPLVFDVLYSGVQRKLASASPARAAVANGLLTASLAFMDALRAVRGLALPSPESALAQDSEAAPLVASGSESRSGPRLSEVLQLAVATVLALLLFPLHFLAKKLVYSKVKAAIPIRKLAVSGGGSLAPHVDKFFEAMGLTLLNGYGLTETSPVLAVRKPQHNVLGTIGTAIAETQIKVVDPETGATLPDGHKGLVKGKGPQIMKGYYKNPAATIESIDEEGWFNTGDIGWITPQKTHGPSRNVGRLLVLEGRAKDTIVLANGENVEPAWVEEAALRSPAISQIMLIGQDQRKLAALVVPVAEELEALVQRRRVMRQQSTAAPASDEEKKEVIQAELIRCLAAAGCGPNERIGRFALLDEPFTIENGMLTATMKMRRNVIYERHQGLCLSLLDANH